MKKNWLRFIALIQIIFLFTGCTLKASGEKGEAGINSSETMSLEIKGEKTGVWSPDNKWVAITTTARNRADTTIFDTIENKEYETGIFRYINEHSDELDFKISGKERTDQYVNFVEWCPDSKKVLLSYSFDDDNNARQTGVAVFNLEKMSIDWMIKLASAERVHTEIRKPEGFSWLAAGYGLENGLIAKDTANAETTYNR